MVDLDELIAQGRDRQAHEPQLAAAAARVVLPALHRAHPIERLTFPS